MWLPHIDHCVPQSFQAVLKNPLLWLFLLHSHQSTWSSLLLCKFIFFSSSGHFHWLFPLVRTPCLQFYVSGFLLLESPQISLLQRNDSEIKDNRIWSDPCFQFLHTFSFFVFINSVTLEQYCICVLVGCLYCLVLSFYFVWSSFQGVRILLEGKHPVFESPIQCKL